MRLDNYLVEKNFFSSRSKAQLAIKSGNIFCNDVCITKNSYLVNDDTNICVKGESLRYVSRGGLKLEKAINSFNIRLEDKVMCDIGSSTGGFSDCALQNGIKKIYAIDVGSNQMSEKLKNNNRIVLFENTDFRNIKEELLKDVNIITIDVSFISVTKIVKKISLLKNVSEIVCLVKPQFECGKENAHKYKGIIINKEIHNDVIANIITAFKNINYFVSGLTFSPIRGGSGNIEYLLYLTKKKTNYKYDINHIIEEAFNNYK